MKEHDFWDGEPAVRIARALLGALGVTSAELLSDSVEASDARALQLMQFLSKDDNVQDVIVRAYALEFLSLFELAQRGWFAPDGTFKVLELFHHAADCSPELGDELIVMFVENRVDEILQRLVSNHPDRAEIICDAFEAHRSGKYTLSIPTLHSQADGLFNDLTNFFLFGTGGIAKKEVRKVADLLGNLDRIMLYCLLVETPLMRSSLNIRAKTNGALSANRNVVLHGAETKYHSRVNSCRLIAYVAHIDYIGNRIRENNLLSRRLSC
jgi:hypothetical protein